MDDSTCDRCGRPRHNTRADIWPPHDPQECIAYLLLDLTGQVKDISDALRGRP